MFTPALPLTAPSGLWRALGKWCPGRVRPRRDRIGGDGGWAPISGRVPTTLRATVVAGGAVAGGAVAGGGAPPERALYGDLPGWVGTSPTWAPPRSLLPTFLPTHVYLLTGCPFGSMVSLRHCAAITFNTAQERSCKQEPTDGRPRTHCNFALLHPVPGEPCRAGLSSEVAPMSQVLPSRDWGLRPCQERYALVRIVLVRIRLSPGLGRLQYPACGSGDNQAHRSVRSVRAAGRSSTTARPRKGGRAPRPR